MEKNKGLATNFQLTKGKFTLTYGDSKVDDNVFLFASFFGFFRVFLKDFAINIYFLYQRNSQVIRQRKNLLQLQILDSASKYLPFAKIEAIDFPEVFNRNIKSIGLSMQYGYNLISISKSKTVTFLKTL